MACQEGLFKEVNFKLRTEMCQPEWIGKVTSEKALPDRDQCAEAQEEKRLVVAWLVWLSG